MSDWYFKTGDDVVGPITNAELLARVRRGEVTPETLLQKGNSKWVLAEEVNGLFEAVGQKALEYHCPDCQEVIHKPPTHCEFCGSFVERARMQRFPVKPIARETPELPAATSWWNRLTETWKRWIQ